MVNLKSVLFLLLVSLVTCVPAFAQEDDESSNLVSEAFSEMGIQPVEIMTQGMSVFGTILVVGVGFMVAVSLVWAAVNWMKRGASDRGGA